MVTKRAFYVLVALITALCAASTSFAADIMWAKGQIHCHSTNSDGNGSPQQVADWYRNHGYQFIILTDHEKMTDPAPISKGVEGTFVMIPGEEIACTSQKVPVHMNAFGIRETLKSPAARETTAATVANMADYIRKAGGLPQVNHPSWYYALSHRDLMSIEGPFLLEVANVSFGCNNEGSLAKLSTEQMWDYLLSNGRTVYAVASDDMHNLNAKPEQDMGPGRGWVCVRVTELTPKAVLDALASGDFYASNGVTLADYSFDGREFKVSVKSDQAHLIRFVGKHGAILQETDGTSATYRVAGTREPDSYVRCKVISGDGKVAWTQAYYIK